MEMVFDFQGEEVAEVMEAIARRMQHIAHQPATAERYASIQALQRFARKLGPVMTAGKAEASEIGCLN